MLATFAAFDFDHTLIDRDSLVPFLIYMNGIGQTSMKLTILTPSFVRFLLGNLSRQGVKEKILTLFFKGLPFHTLQHFGDLYADTQLDRFIKPKALERLHWHIAQGHRCLLISASLEFYLKPWAKRHGFEDVLASRLELTPTGTVTGRLDGLNCWGEEKKRRLLAYLDPKETIQLYVYGDSRGDQELLAMADYPFYRRF